MGRLMWDGAVIALNMAILLVPLSLFLFTYQAQVLGL